MNRRLAIYEPDDESEKENPAACRATLIRLQNVLDGEESDASLAEDTHARECTSCRERIRAARLMTRSLKANGDWPSSQVRTDSLVAVVSMDRLSRTRQRWRFAAAGVSVAVAVMIMVFGTLNPTPVQPDQVIVENHPTPTPVAPTPAPKLGEALADASSALQSIGRQITDTPETPAVFAPIAEAFGETPMNPLAANFEPVAKTLSDLPDAALSSLEPVTGSATRAFTRLLQDVTAVQPVKSKS